MLHSALVITAYLMMIFVPCACAQWGDVLMAEWWQARFAQRRYKRLRVRGVAPVVATIRAEAVAMEVETLAAAAFVEPTPMEAPRFVAKPVRYRAMKHRAPVDPAAVEKMQGRVAMRLAQIAEAMRMESLAAMAEAAETGPPIVQEAVVSASAPSRQRIHLEPVPIAPIMTPMVVRTPTVDELEALYAMERLVAEQMDRLVAEQRPASGPPGEAAVGAAADSGDAISIAA